MARIFSLETHEKVPASEKKALAAFGELDDDWTILHSVAWQNHRGGRQSDGEADLVLIHPRMGIIVLEVKGGGIHLVNGSWISENHTGRYAIKDPFRQATESKHTLLAYLRDSLGWFTTRARVCHGVVFPDIVVSKAIEAAGPRQIIIDAEGLRDPNTSIGRLTTHWTNNSNLSKKDISDIVGKLAPSTSIRPPLSVWARQVSDELIKLTQEQKVTLDGLSRNRRALILGGAGTGKTVLAVEKAIRLAEAGCETLLVCYNELLGRYLEKTLAQVRGVTVARFHSLVFKLAKQAEIAVPDKLDEQWWSEGAPVVLLDAARVLGYAPDAVLIDEAQDFEWDWIEALITLTREPLQSICFIFGDPLQDLYRRPWSPPVSWAQFELSLNCRNSLPIARRVAHSIGSPPPKSGALGPEPTFVSTNLQRDGYAALQQHVEKLINVDGFKPSEIVVLADAPKIVGELLTISAGVTPFCKYGEKGVMVETIQRFKGLESEATIIVCNNDNRHANKRERAYVGLSRARSVLFVFAPATERQSLGFD